MASAQLPYLHAYGNISKCLERIKSASTPDRFTQDFLDTRLALKGGSAKPLIPFLKKTGFLSTDGSPTDIYRKFRNDDEAGAAAAAALKIGYAPLYEVNEYVHELPDDRLKGVIVQVTGAESSSPMVKSAAASFKALRAFADFDAELMHEPRESDSERKNEPDDPSLPKERPPMGDIRLAYTINLNLPATSDIAVFDAIFKSLREHLLR